MLNKAAVDKLLEMPDDKLLPMLRFLLTGLGADDPDRYLKRLDQKTLPKLRRTLTEVSERDLERLSYLMEVYKNG